MILVVISHWRVSDTRHITEASGYVEIDSGFTLVVDKSPTSVVFPMLVRYVILISYKLISISCFPIVLEI